MTAPTYDKVFSRAWPIAYALTHGHDPRPLDLAWGGFNRFELDRDGPEIARMGNFITSMERVIEETKDLPPWEAARACAKAEAKALGYDKRSAQRFQRDLRRMERAQRDAGIIQIGRVSHGTIAKWLWAAGPK